MAFQKPQFVDNEIYHIYNRGVEKRKIFLGGKDFLRFIHSLFEFNDKNPAVNVSYYFNPLSLKTEHQNIKEERRDRKLLVEVLAFTLMPNHFHLLLRQITEGGIITFMQKLGTGYTMYFNKKYERVGGLFQGRFKAVLVHTDAHFIHLPFYIHTNPVDLLYRGSTSIEKQINFLETYRWSSFPDYIGKKNFPSVTSRDFLLDFFRGEAAYKKATFEWLRERNQNKETIKTLTLE